MSRPAAQRGCRCPQGQHGAGAPSVWRKGVQYRQYVLLEQQYDKKKKKKIINATKPVVVSLLVASLQLGSIPAFESSPLQLIIKHRAFYLLFMTDSFSILALGVSTATNPGSDTQPGLISAEQPLCCEQELGMETS